MLFPLLPQSSPVVPPAFMESIVVARCKASSCHMLNSVCSSECSVSKSSRMRKGSPNPSKADDPQAGVAWRGEHVHWSCSLWKRWRGTQIAVHKNHQGQGKGKQAMTVDCLFVYKNQETSNKTMVWQVQLQQNGGRLGNFLPQEVGKDENFHVFKR